ncbi:MAG: CDP-diacylglycerol--serine O-phosphatidyltransferase [Clostridiaceae bacterium]|jgi:CDP-diacylglycerol--serine O-phosphatidyltransferase|nr:CDP-diacylglycerol--serine O-phosphatidyltransferase [Clostridiaceae bacterium]
MIRKNLPNMLTLANLALGVLAILVASSTGKFSISQPGDDINLVYYSCLCVMAAAVFDRFDGKLARRLDAASELGKQLDSLCDLISFGVAPAVIAWKLHFAYASLFFPFGRLAGYLLAVLFPIAGAIRLARFNLQEDASCFYGIPITLAGSLLTLLNLLHTFLFLKGRFGLTNIIVCMALMVVLSFFMVSKIQIRKI